MANFYSLEELEAFGVSRPLEELDLDRVDLSVLDLSCIGDIEDIVPGLRFLVGRVSLESALEWCSNWGVQVTRVGSRYNIEFPDGTLREGLRGKDVVGVSKGVLGDLPFEVFAGGLGF